MIIIILMMFLGWIYSLVYTYTPRGLLLCGLAGFSGYKNKKVDVTKMKMLLLLNQSRGIHATGVYGNQLFKKADKAEDFIKHPGLITAISGANVVIGHTRHGTMGSNTDRDLAHPFALRHTSKETKKTTFLAGTHNGGIFPGHIDPLCKKYNLKTPDVDSRLIFEIIMVSGYNWDVIGDIEGNIALGFTYEDKLHLYRRNNRPLYIGETDEGVYYSSLESPLEMIGCRGITDLQPWTMFRFNNGIVDKIWHPKKPVVISLPEDASTSKAHQVTNLPKEERDEITRYSKNTVVEGFKFSKDNKKKEGAEEKEKRTKDAGTTSSGGIITRIRETGDEEVAGLIRGLDADRLSLTNALDIDTSDQIRELRKDILSKDTIVCLNLLTDDAKKSKPIPQMLVWVQGHEEINTISCDVGLAILKIPDELVDGNLSILMADPFCDWDAAVNRSDFNYYITNLKLSKGRILEVILSLPFQFKFRRFEVEGEDQGELNNSNESIEGGTDEKGSIFIGVDGFGSEDSLGLGSAEDDEEIQEAVEVSIIEQGHEGTIQGHADGGGSSNERSSNEGDKEGKKYLNADNYPMWTVEGYVSLKGWVNGSNHNAAEDLRKINLCYGKNNNIIGLKSIRDLSKELKFFMGSELRKYEAMIKRKENSRESYVLRSAFGGVEIINKHAGNKNVMEMSTDNYIKGVKSQIESASERLHFMGEHLDECESVLSEISPDPDSLKEALITSLGIINKLYEQEENSKVSLSGSIENIVPF